MNFEKQNIFLKRKSDNKNKILNINEFQNQNRDLIIKNIDLELNNFFKYYKIDLLNYKFLDFPKYFNLIDNTFFKNLIFLVSIKVFTDIYSTEYHIEFSKEILSKKRKILNKKYFSLFKIFKLSIKSIFYLIFHFPLIFIPIKKNINTKYLFINPFYHYNSKNSEFIYWNKLYADKNFISKSIISTFYPGFNFKKFKIDTDKFKYNINLYFNSLHFLKLSKSFFWRLIVAIKIIFKIKSYKNSYDNMFKYNLIESLVAPQFIDDTINYFSISNFLKKNKFNKIIFPSECQNWELAIHDYSNLINIKSFVYMHTGVRKWDLRYRRLNKIININSNVLVFSDDCKKNLFDLFNVDLKKINIVENLKISSKKLNHYNDSTLYNKNYKICFLGSISFNSDEYIIDELLKNKFNFIYKPHPSNIDISRKKINNERILIFDNSLNNLFKYSGLIYLTNINSTINLELLHFNKLFISYYDPLELDLGLDILKNINKIKISDLSSFDFASFFLKNKKTYRSPKANDKIIRFLKAIDKNV